MTKRVDQASRVMQASPARIYQAFTSAKTMESWLPPKGMTGRVISFDFREGGSYRMRLSYNGPHQAQGKTSDNADEVEVQILKLIPDKRIEQGVTFASDKPEFSGVMKIIWAFDAVRQGTRVTVRCENVPPGISAEDHEAGLMSTLENLARFAK